MVGQHDAARPHTNGLSGRRQMSNHHRGGRARDAGHVVVFGDPVPMITPGFGLDCQLLTALERTGCVAAKRDGDEVENAVVRHKSELLMMTQAVCQSIDRGNR